MNKRKESPLDILYARGGINKTQFAAGSRFRADFERAGLEGQCSHTRFADPSLQSSGTPSKNAAEDNFLKRVEALHTLQAALGTQNTRGKKILMELCIAKKTYQALGEEMGVNHKYISERFKEILDDLAQHYGNTLQKSSRSEPSF